MTAPLHHAPAGSGHHGVDRHELGLWLVAIELLVAAGAVFGAVMLLLHERDGFLPATYLDDLPFDTWTWAALALVAVDAVLPTVAAGAEISGRPWALAAHAAAGAGLVGWIALQVALIGLVHPLQPLIALLGVVVLALAAFAARAEA